MNMATFFDQTKWYSTQKKRLFQMVYFKFHEKNYWESSNLTNSKITPSRENYAHFISCKPPHKNYPREYFGTTLCFIQIATSVVEKSQILSVAFHLATTVHKPKQKTHNCSSSLCRRPHLHQPFLTWNITKKHIGRPSIYLNTFLSLLHRHKFFSTSYSPLVASHAVHEHNPQDPGREVLVLDGTAEDCAVKH